ncbi:MAG TPA: hypothetical protein VLS44_05350 [Nitrospira sp.]|nr:hypothetical protein [Nitrospira sp.]
MRGDLAQAQHNVGDQLRSGFRVQFGQQGGFQERELLKPDGIRDDEVELFGAKLSGPGVRRDGLPDDLAPLLLQTQFHQVGLETQPLGEPRENGAE